MQDWHEGKRTVGEHRPRLRGWWISKAESQQEVQGGTRT